MTAAHLRRPPISVAVLDLLGRSHATLESACRTTDASERFRDAHLGALRAAAALVASRTTPSPRSRPRSVWQVLPVVAPELGEWAAFFAACSVSARSWTGEATSRCARPTTCSGRPRCSSRSSRTSSECHRRSRSRSRSPP